VKLEKKIFDIASKMNHPFMVNLHSSFQNDSRVFFVMEYVCGGDLSSHIITQKRFSQTRTKFYTVSEPLPTLICILNFYCNNFHSVKFFLLLNIFIPIVLFIAI
jgi:serine/threonine protein kinase